MDETFLAMHVQRPSSRPSRLARMLVEHRWGPELRLPSSDDRALDSAIGKFVGEGREEDGVNSDEASVDNEERGVGY